MWFVSVVYFFMSFIILIYENDYSKIYIAIIFVNTKKNGIKLKINNLFIIEILKWPIEIQKNIQDSIFLHFFIRDLQTVLML